MKAGNKDDGGSEKSREGINDGERDKLKLRVKEKGVDKRRKSQKEKKTKMAISDDRLKAYGISVKKFKFGYLPKLKEKNK